MANLYDLNRVYLKEGYFKRGFLFFSSRIYNLLWIWFIGGDPEKIKESQKKRYAKVELVDEVIELDQEWRKGKNIFIYTAFELNVTFCFMNVDFTC